MYDSSSHQPVKPTVVHTTSHEKYAGCIVKHLGTFAAYGYRKGRRVALALDASYTEASAILEAWLRDRQMAVTRYNALRTMRNGYCIVGRVPSGRSRSFSRCLSLTI